MSQPTWGRVECIACGWVGPAHALPLHTPFCAGANPPPPSPPPAGR